MNGRIKNERKIQERRRSPSTLTTEQIEEFFKATEDGSVERLDKLFNERANANPNMTRFTESLLMAAIRRGRNDIADYLIDQLAVNVQYGANLREFRRRSRIPCRYRTFTCRDLAYEKGMMELVDLIDLTSTDVKPNIKRYLKARLQPRLDHIHEEYVKRLEQRKYQLFQTNQQRECKPSPFNSRSFVEESTESIHPSSNDKSIDETRKKTFRFSNYTLRFHLEDTPSKQQSSLKTTFPMLSQTSLFVSNSTPSFTNTHRKLTLPRITHVETKPSMKYSSQYRSSFKPTVANLPSNMR